MREQDIQRIRAAAWAAGQPKAALIETLADVVQSSVRAEFERAPHALEGEVGSRGLSRAADHDGQPVVVISMEELAELLEAVAKPLSFGEAMTAMAFETAFRPQPKTPRGNRRNPTR